MIKGDDEIVIDLINSPQKEYNRLFIFDKYKSVTEINDSTKFYIVKEKSLYGINMNNYVVWSNPLYEIYNKQ